MLDRITAPGFRIRSGVHRAAFSSDGRLLATGGRRVSVWDVEARKRLVTRFTVPNPGNFAFSPDARLLVVEGGIRSVALCDTASLEVLQRHRSKDWEELRALRFLRQDLVLDATLGGAIRTRSTADLEPQVVWRKGHAMVTEALSDAEGRRWLFDVNTKWDHPEGEPPVERLLVTESPQHGPFEFLDRAWGRINAVDLSPDGRRAVVDASDTAVLEGGGWNFSLEVLDVPSGRTLVTGRSDGTGGMHLAWSRDQRHVVYTEWHGFSFRRADDLEEVGWLPSNYAEGATFSPRGDLLVLCDAEQGLVVPWPDVLTKLSPRPSRRVAE